MVKVVEALPIDSSMLRVNSTTKRESPQAKVILQSTNKEALSLQRVQVMGGGNDPRLVANVDMEHAFAQAPDNDIIAYVQLFQH
jgi:hypothetical protein